MSNFNLPMSELGPRDEADGMTLGDAQPQQVPADINYAEDPEMVRAVQDQIVPIVRQTRYDRRSMEALWQAIRRMANMQHDDGQAYKGRSNVYLPVHTKNRQSLTSSLSRGLFPSDDYMDVMAVDPQDIDKSKNLKMYLQYEFEVQAKLRLHMKLFFNQLMDYGFSVLKAWYQKDQQFGRARTKRMNTMDMLTGAMGTGYETRFTKSADEGLRVSARNIFNFHLYPFTAETLDDTTVQFEDVLTSIGQLKVQFLKGQWLRWEEVEKSIRDEPERVPDMIASAPLPQSVQPDFSEQHSVANVPTSHQMMGTELGDLRMVTEVYTFLRLPKSAYTEADSPDCPLPVRIVMVNEEPVSITRNPYYHQRSPFLAVALNASPGFYYGWGPGKQVRPLQYLANDFANQTNDNGIYALNPIVKVNPGLLTGPLRPIRPGVTWTMTDVDNGVKFERPPFEQVQMGLQMLETVIGQAQDFGGAPPVLQGLGAGKGAKTATGAQILQHNAQQPLQDIIEDIECQVCVPLMELAWHLGMQYRSEKTMVSVFGISKEIAKDDLLFEAKMRWLASSQSVNAQLRSQQATQFLQSVLPTVPLLQQLGYKLDPVPLLKRIYSDGFGFRGFDEFISKQSPPMGGMPGPTMPSQATPLSPGGGQTSNPPPGDRVRSTTEQAATPGQEAVPGEGPDFMNVRQNSDDISGLLGGNGGGQ